MSTLIVEAFGQLSLGTNLIDSEEEDLYSVFRARSELMCWSSTSLPRSHRPLLWGMEEAELTARADASQIGFVQVGLDVGDFEPNPNWTPSTSPGWASLPVRRRPTEPAMAIPPLVQCFDDSLRRFGDVELSALQVTARYLDPSARCRAGDLISGLNWFNTTRRREWMRSSPLIKSCSEVIPRQNWSPASNGGTADRSSSDLWQPCPSSTLSRYRNGRSTPSPLRARVSACRSHCQSGRRVPWGGCCNRHRRIARFCARCRRPRSSNNTGSVTASANCCRN